MVAPDFRFFLVLNANHKGLHSSQGNTARLTKLSVEIGIGEDAAQEAEGQRILLIRTVLSGHPAG